jgi:hypothetical protein
MQFTVGESGGKFGASEGQHVAKFLGVTMMPTHDDAGKLLPPKIGQDGKPMEPGMSWEFEVAEGSDKGKIASRISGKHPNPKNIAGRLMAAVSGKYLKPGVEINLDQYVGKLYLITVEPTSTGKGTRISDTPAPSPYTGAAPAASPPASSGPPPRRGTTNAGKPAPAFYWVETNPDADPIKVADLRKFFTENEGKLDARTCLVCPDGGSEYKAAVDFDSSLLF